MLTEESTINKPGVIPEYYSEYLNNVPDDGRLIKHLGNIIDETEDMLNNLSEEKLNYRYREDKWTIKEILVHIIDIERIVVYRATRIARGDSKTLMSAFDEKLFTEHTNTERRHIHNILNELRVTRQASIVFIETLRDEDLDRTGFADGMQISCRLLVNYLLGHHRHHLNIIEERYLA